jgi:hypothetical protein
MEKTGDTLNQLAIICDLVEKVNFDFTSVKISYNVNANEFKNIYNYTSRKTGEEFVPLKETAKTFSININDVQLTFNKNNV